MSSVGRQWHGGMATTIATITLEHTSECWIADDPWVHRKRNNAAYFISLNGVDRTGMILEGSTGIADPAAAGFTISPVPFSNGPLSIHWDGPCAGQLEVGLWDAAGRFVHGAKLDCPALGMPAMLEGLPDLANGGYTLNIRTGDGIRTHTMVVSHRSTTP